MAIISIFNKSGGDGWTGYVDSTGSTFLIGGTNSASAANAGFDDNNTFNNTPWTKLNTAENSISPNGCALSYIANPTTVGVNHAGSAIPFVAYAGASFIGYTGVGAFDKQDFKSYNNSATSHPTAAGTITPSADNSMLLSLFAPIGDPGTVTPPIGWTLRSNASATGTYKVYIAEKIQTTAVAETPTWTTTNSTNSCGTVAVFAPPAVPGVISGGATLGDITASGTLATAGLSVLSGAATLGDITATGSIAPQPGVITTPVLKNNTGSILASVTGVVANVYNLSTGALVVRKTGLSSNGSGIVTISDAALIPGTSYAYEIDLSSASLGRRLPSGVAA